MGFVKSNIAPVTVLSVVISFCILMKNKKMVKITTKMNMKLVMVITVVFVTLIIHNYPPKGR